MRNPPRKPEVIAETAAQNAAVLHPKMGPPAKASKLQREALADGLQPYENPLKFAKLHDSPNPAWDQFLITLRLETRS